MTKHYLTCVSKPWHSPYLTEGKKYEVEFVVDLARFEVQGTEVYVCVRDFDGNCFESSHGTFVYSKEEPEEYPTAGGYVRYLGRETPHRVLVPGHVYKVEDADPHSPSHSFEFDFGGEWIFALFPNCAHGKWEVVSVSDFHNPKKDHGIVCVSTGDKCWTLGKRYDIVAEYGDRDMACGGLVDEGGCVVLDDDGDYRYVYMGKVVDGFTPVDGTSSHGEFRYDATVKIEAPVEEPSVEPHTPKKGDYIICRKTHKDRFTVGEKYKIMAEAGDKDYVCGGRVYGGGCIVENDNGDHAYVHLGYVHHGMVSSESCQGDFEYVSATQEGIESKSELKDGDIVRCVDNRYHRYLTKGRRYVITNVRYSDETVFSIIADDGDLLEYCLFPSCAHGKWELVER